MIIDRIYRICEDDKNINAAFISKKENVRYFSKFKGDDSFLLLTRDGKRYVITDFRYTEQAKMETEGLFEIIDYRGKLYEVIFEILSKNNIGVLHFEPNNITYNVFCEMKEKLNGIEIVPYKFRIDELSMIKDDEEIDIIKKAVEIADIAFEHILNYIKPGISELDISSELGYCMLKQGAKGFSFEPIVASGKRSSLPHGVASNKKIENGDVVTIDFGCNFDGYMSDMTRTVFVGKADKTILKIYNIVKEAQKVAEEFIRSGIKGFEVDKIARDYIGSFGYAEKFGHGLGHGVGLEIHELPTLSLKSESILQRNMVVTIEPGIYIENFGGVRIEDLVVVKEDGCEILTKSTKEVIVL